MDIRIDCCPNDTEHKLLWVSWGSGRPSGWFCENCGLYV